MPPWGHGQPPFSQPGPHPLGSKLSTPVRLYPCAPVNLGHNPKREEKEKSEEQHLPRTTERPARECGDECSQLPRREVPQSHGRKSVVRGLLKKVDRDGDRCPFVNDDVKGPGELFLRELLPPNPE